MDTARASRIRAWRKRANLSQAQLAEMLGQAQPTISAWESGADVPSSKLERLAKACGAVDLAEFWSAEFAPEAA